MYAMSETNRALGEGARGPAVPKPGFMAALSTDGLGDPEKSPTLSGLMSYLDLGLPDA